jgi:hypothetical protein
VIKLILNLVKQLKLGSKSEKSRLLKHLINLVSQEYDASVTSLTHQLKSADAELGKFFAQELQLMGWRVTWYQMPCPPPGVDHTSLAFDEHEYRCASFGFVVDDACEELCKWRMMQ